MAELRRSSLRLRLLAAFLIVAGLAVAAFAGLILQATGGEMNDLLRRQQQSTLHEAAGALADAYRESGSWTAADLRPAQAVAVASGALLQLRNSRGAIVEQPGVPPGLWAAAAQDRAQDGTVRTAAVVVAGERVGGVALRFPRTGLPPPEQRLRNALLRTALIGLAVAALVAVAVGIVVSGLVLRPLRRLVAAVDRIDRGDRAARVELAAPGELGALADSVDRMSARLEREEKLRRDLVADVSHELRTPVTILTAECERLADGTIEPRPELFVSLHEETLRLGRAIEDVEALAASRASPLPVDLRPTRLDHVTAAVAETLRPQFETANLHLHLHLTPATVDGDADRLAQIARNLLTNALKFCRPGGDVTVSVEARGAEAVLTVEDTGFGIAPEDLPHVFERFWRGPEARGVSGQGVGLAVVDELTRAHGGRVDIASDGVHGTTFTVSFPRLERASAVHGRFIRSPHRSG